MSLNTLLLSFSLLFAGYTFTPAPSNISTIKTDDPVFSTALSGQLSGTINQKDLSELKPDIVVYKNQDPAEGYEVKSFVVIVVRKNEKEPLPVYTENGSRLDDDALAVVQGLKAGDQIIIDQVRANTPKEGVRSVAPKVYMITE